MQTQTVSEYKSSADVIDFGEKRVALQQLKNSKNKNEVKACFRSDERYLCQDRDCSLWGECQQLVAEWMR
ncbi:MAG TPA: hypothetical protein ENJ32_12565 [Crenotrichaceae bacterium]|nr:hypothetical protein [Crenotrichaceae bacterium]